MLGGKQDPIMQLESILTCPKCSHQAVETMPTDACQFFYDCKGCGQRLKPLAGECCVFCSFGAVPANTGRGKLLRSGDSLDAPGPKGEKRPADVIGNAVHVMRIATGEIEDDPRKGSGAQPKAGKCGPYKNENSN